MKALYHLFSRVCQTSTAHFTLAFNIFGILLSLIVTIVFTLQSSPPASFQYLVARERILARPIRGRIHIHRDRHVDNDCVVFIRCNGREFHIELSPFFLCNSPSISTRYDKFMAAPRDEVEMDAEEEHPEEIVASFHDWLIDVFKPPLLSEYLFPETHRCRFESEVDKPFPIYMPDEESEFAEPLCHIRPDLAREVERYVKFFDPSVVRVSFQRPKQALNDNPTRVLVYLDGSGEMTTCFFKGFSPGEDDRLEKEVEAHLRILKSNVVPEARVIRLLGVVAVADGRVAGLLLTYVDCRRDYDGILDGIYLRRTPVSLRERWIAQIREAVQQLHEGGAIWGDAKADNVLIDKNDDAWLIDFGGGYTEGWVDKDKTDTKEGDLQGVERIAEYLFSEEYESASSDEQFDFDSASE
ncbi:hypothetical protein N656DRAFT_793429 [Canariomyces notabilis]|uniref:Protein kinase domain-containing protein n=1 Tax=Canariomyces notabilis TaxID=2074819 RepID=A0AAN6T7G0_9PEZI|nr:hypothetical protein N656DRAFT_793429 [Canariomyces arenarius]